MVAEIFTATSDISKEAALAAAMAQVGAHCDKDSRVVMRILECCEIGTNQYIARVMAFVIEPEEANNQMSENEENNEEHIHQEHIRHRMEHERAVLDAMMHRMMIDMDAHQKEEFDEMVSHLFLPALIEVPHLHQKIEGDFDEATHPHAANDHYMLPSVPRIQAALANARNAKPSGGLDEELV